MSEPHTSVFNFEFCLYVRPSVHPSGPSHTTYRLRIVMDWGPSGELQTLGGGGGGGGTPGGLCFFVYCCIAFVYCVLCYVSLFNVLYSVLGSIKLSLYILSTAKSLSAVFGLSHLVAAVGSTARQSVAGPTSPEQQKMMPEKQRERKEREILRHKQESPCERRLPRE